jgi:predicted nucleic acid-binding protein
MVGLVDTNILVALADRRDQNHALRDSSGRSLMS